MSRSVLIVEDDALLAEVYQKSLAADNIKTTVASNCKEAVAKFKLNSTRLIILDIILNNGNGFEVLKKIRKVPGANQVPIIIVTGLNTDEIDINKELRVSLNIIGIYTKSQLSVNKLVEAVKFGIQQHERA